MLCCVCCVIDPEYFVLAASSPLAWAPSFVLKIAMLKAPQRRRAGRMQEMYVDFKRGMVRLFQDMLARNLLACAEIGFRHRLCGTRRNHQRNTYTCDLPRFPISFQIRLVCLWI
jgi:hypothetical protein